MSNQLVSTRSFTPAQLSLIKNTVASDCNDQEFDLFMEICKQQGLDPFRKQIYAFVFTSTKRYQDDNGRWQTKQERRLTPVTSIDGYRSKADRCGNYRPDEDEPLFTIDESLKDEASNPLGLVKAVVRAFKYGPDHKWHTITGVAYWEEYAPIIEDGAWQDGKFKPNGKLILDKKKPNWRKMPLVMLAKCAEAQALRRGWPNEFSGLYVQEEMDQATIIDVTATEAAEQHEKDKRKERIGGKSSIPCVLNMTEGLKLIPSGKFADAVLDHISTFETADDVDEWMECNKPGLQQFWAEEANDALALKREIEKLQSNLPARGQDQQQAG